jgi:hypothetical protein
MQVTGHTLGINPYGKLANDQRFYNSDIAVYYDPESKKLKKFLVADDVYQADPKTRDVSDLWATGVSQLHQVVKHKLDNTEIEFQDEDKVGIKVYGVDGGKFKEPKIFPDYESLYNAIAEYNSNKGK